MSAGGSCGAYLAHHRHESFGQPLGLAADAGEEEGAQRLTQRRLRIR